MQLREFLTGLLLGTALLVVAGCSSSTSAVENAEGTDAKKQTVATVADDAEKQEKNTETKAEVNNTETAQAKIIKRKGKVADRGVFIKILVNRNPITNLDLRRRAAFLRLRRAPGNRTQLAEDEMIEQILKLQEATRANVLATDDMVEAAFQNFAKQNRSTPAQLGRALSQAGVGTEHFKSFIRTQISWQRAVSRRFQAETVRVTEQDAILQLRESGDEKPQLTEYNFQQIIFVVPKNNRSKAKLAARRVEANAFRQRFTTCDETIQLAKTLKDVSVIERKRILDLELPERWKDEVKRLDSRGTSRAKETEKGVELIAICNTRQVNDDRAAQISTQSQEFESFNTKGNDLSKRYLDQLKSRATIIYQ